jgi:hypothetical protein
VASSRLRGGRPPRLRRLSSLVFHLDGSRLVAEDFLAHRRYEINDDALALLKRFDRWRDPGSVVAGLAGYAPESVRESIEILRVRRLLVAEGSDAGRAQERLAGWAAWSPAAAYFHFATRGDRFARTGRELRAIVARVTRTRMPSIYKDMPGPRRTLGPPSARLAPASLGRRSCHGAPAASSGEAAAAHGSQPCVPDVRPRGWWTAGPTAGCRTAPGHPRGPAIRSSAMSSHSTWRASNAASIILVRETPGEAADVAATWSREFTCGQAWFAEAAAVFVSPPSGAHDVEVPRAARYRSC